jgi:hypothetical protein
MSGSDDEKLWNWLRKTFPPAQETYDWIVVISPFKEKERTDWTLFNQRAVRIVKAIDDEAVVEAEDGGQRARIPIRWIYARCRCPWQMGLRGCECGAMERDRDVNDLCRLLLPED